MRPIVDDFSIQNLLPKTKAKAEAVYNVLKGMTVRDARMVLDVVDYQLSAAATLTGDSIIKDSTCESPAPSISEHKS